MAVTGIQVHGSRTRGTRSGDPETPTRLEERLDPSLTPVRGTRLDKRTALRAPAPDLAGPPRSSSAAAPGEVRRSGKPTRLKVRLDPPGAHEPSTIDCLSLLSRNFALFFCFRVHRKPLQCPYLCSSIASQPCSLDGTPPKPGFFGMPSQCLLEPLSAFRCIVSQCDPRVEQHCACIRTGRPDNRDCRFHVGFLHIGESQIPTSTI